MTHQEVNDTVMTNGGQMPLKDITMSSFSPMTLRSCMRGMPKQNRRPGQSADHEQVKRSLTLKPKHDVVEEARRRVLGLPPLEEMKMQQLAADQWSPTKYSMRSPGY